MSRPFLDRRRDQAHEFFYAKGVTDEHSALRDVRLTLLKNCAHLAAKSALVAGREEVKKKLVEAEHHGHASFGDTRRLARRVSCFIRATSASRFCRPLGVSR